MKLLRRFVGFLSCHRKAIAVCLVAITIGACFRWEVRAVDDARTGKPITRYRGVVLPWEPCGASGGGTLINFQVRQWLCYGLIKVEAKGQTM